MNNPFKGGYLGKLIRVNLSTRTWKAETIDAGLFESLLGGRGVAAKYYYDEIGPDTGPFDEGNKLYFFYRAPDRGGPPLHDKISAGNEVPGNEGVPLFQLQR
ncbi:MAG: hypothetical protein E4H36_15155 [Spirochaetales bacterium]|nr:MAG: hypothetical protein E4H36_15155 [Spirochaetales bacterium]